MMIALTMTTQVGGGDGYELSVSGFNAGLSTVGDSLALGKIQCKVRLIMGMCVSNVFVRRVVRFEIGR